MEVDDMNIDRNHEEEYILLDLDAVCGQVDIPPDEPYTLSGLDTLNPVLTIGDKLKLIGEYEETVGTCLIFSEKEKSPLIHEGTVSSEANIFKGSCTANPDQVLAKQIKPVTSLHKVLKFKLLSEPDEQDLTEKSPDPSPQRENSGNEK